VDFLSSTLKRLDVAEHLNFDDAHSLDEMIEPQDDDYNLIGTSEKQTRHEPVPWHALELSVVLWYADYYTESRKMRAIGHSGQAKVIKGNQFQFRVLNWSAVRLDNFSDCPLGLPANFYNPKFIDTLLFADRALLEVHAKPEIDLPDVAAFKVDQDLDFQQWVDYSQMHNFYAKCLAT
jgi:hypothetical protein